MPLHYCPKKDFWIENIEKITKEWNKQNWKKNCWCQQKINTQSDLKSLFFWCTNNVQAFSFPTRSNSFFNNFTTWRYMDLKIGLILPKFREILSWMMMSSRWLQINWLFFTFFKTKKSKLVIITYEYSYSIAFEYFFRNLPS